MKPKRKDLLESLLKEYNILKGKRFMYSKKKNWYLTKFERIAAVRIERHLRKLKSCPICDIYALPELRIIWPNNNIRKYAVKYLIMFFRSMNVVNTKCNNGYKIIAWNNEREHRILKLRATKRT